jgi:hypothetical protein
MNNVHLRVQLCDVKGVPLVDGPKGTACDHRAHIDAIHDTIWPVLHNRTSIRIISRAGTGRFAFVYPRLLRVAGVNLKPGFKLESWYLYEITPHEDDDGYTKFAIWAANYELYAVNV